MELPNWLNWIMLAPAAVAFVYALYVLTKRLRRRKELNGWTFDTEIRAAGRIVEAHIKGDKVKLLDKTTGKVLFEESIPEINNVRERRRRIVELLRGLTEDS